MLYHIATCEFSNDHTIDDNNHPAIDHTFYTDIDNFIIYVILHFFSVTNNFHLDFTFGSVLYISCFVELILDLQSPNSLFNCVFI
jgi:hypothetical protein